MALIPNFGNNLPVKVRFGDEISLTLPDVLVELGATSVFVMVDEGIENFNPAAAQLLERLNAVPGLSVTRFDKSPAEPTIDMVDEATAALTASGATALVALGGGSVMDTAKAARLCAQHGVGFAGFVFRPRRVRDRKSLVGPWCRTRPQARSRESPMPICVRSMRWSIRC